MADKIAVRGELYPTGGPGRFILARAEDGAEVLANYSGRVKLICIDPPFGTGDSFAITPVGSKQKLVVPIYSDSLSREKYLAMMRAALSACHELLSADGSIYLHIDYRMSPYMRLMMDDIFGEKNFMNEIVWTYKSGGRSLRHYSRKHDTILFYRKSPKVYFNLAAVGSPRGAKKRNNMKRTVDEFGRVCYSIKSGKKTYVYHENMPVFPSDVWDDIEHMHQRDPERTGFATQKPEALLKRMILASSEEGDIVLDLFSGSGTTAAAASALGRRYLAIDSSSAAMAVMRARQLVAHSETTFFKTEAEMSIEYQDMPWSELEADFSLSRTDTKTTVRLGSVYGKWALAFAALGSVNTEGFFVPDSYTLVPSYGSELTGSGSASALLLSDYAGGLCVYRI